MIFCEKLFIFIDMAAVFLPPNSGANNIAKKVSFEWSSHVAISMDSPRNCSVGHDFLFVICILNINNTSLYIYHKKKIF